MNALLILTLVIGIIWFVPIVCRKIHVPSIVGFILAGIVMGPSVLNVLGSTSTIRILGSLGMLYIMFQSGYQRFQTIQISLSILWLVHILHSIGFGYCD